MEDFKLLMRIIIVVVLFIPIYILMFTATLYLLYGLLNVSTLLGKNSREELIEDWYIFSVPFWIPLKLMYQYMMFGNKTYIKALAEL